MQTWENRVKIHRVTSVSYTHLDVYKRQIYFILLYRRYMQTLRKVTAGDANYEVFRTACLYHQRFQLFERL